MRPGHCSKTVSCQGVGNCTCKCETCSPAHLNDIVECKAELERLTLSRYRMEARLKKCKGRIKLFNMNLDAMEAVKFLSKSCDACHSNGPRKKIGMLNLCEQCAIGRKSDA